MEKLCVLLELLDQEWKLICTSSLGSIMFSCDFYLECLENNKQGVGITPEKCKNRYVDSFARLLLRTYNVLGLVLQGLTQWFFY